MDNHLRNFMLAPLPSGVTPRLIDNDLLQLEASTAGFAERYSRGTTSYAIHVWWARRPHTSMRSIAFAALCKGNSIQVQKGLKRLSQTLTLDSQTQKGAEQLIQSQDFRKPRT